MTRIDGEYPKYQQVDFTKDEPPAGWNSGSRRCIECYTSWPNVAEFSPSPCCNVNAGIAGTPPEMEWEVAFKALMRFRFEKFYEKWNDGATDEDLVWADVEIPYSQEDFDNGLQEIQRIVDEQPQE